MLKPKRTIFAPLSKETCVVSKNKYLNLDDNDQEYRALYPKKKQTFVFAVQIENALLENTQESSFYLSNTRTQTEPYKSTLFVSFPHTHTCKLCVSICNHTANMVEFG